MGKHFLWLVSFAVTLTWSLAGSASCAVLLSDDVAEADYREAVRRTASELRALGFRVRHRMDPRTLDTDLAREISSRSNCVAVVSLKNDDGPNVHASVSVWNAQTGGFIESEIGHNPPLPAEVLSIRVAEFIEAGLIELDLPKPSAVDESEEPQVPGEHPEDATPPVANTSPSPGTAASAPTQTPVQVDSPQPERAAVKVADPEFALGAATGLMWGPGGLPATAAWQASLGLHFSDRLQARIEGTLTQSVDSQHETAATESSQQLLLASLRVALPSPRPTTAWFVEPMAGIYRLASSGRAQFPERGVDDSAIVFAGGIGVGSRWRFWKYLALQGGIQTLLTAPRPVLEFPEVIAARAPFPLIVGHIGLEATW